MSFPPKGTLITIPEWPPDQCAVVRVVALSGLLAGVVAQAVDGLIPAI